MKQICLIHYSTAIGANKFMDNAFEEALSPNHCREVSLLARRSREARQRRASKLVCNIVTCIRWTEWMDGWMNGLYSIV